jgi:hypothetical protein
MKKPEILMWHQTVDTIDFPKAISGYCPERFACMIISLICDFRL